MMQEHMNVEEFSALGSTPSMLIVSFPYAPVLCHFCIIFVTPKHLYNATFFGIKLFYGWCYFWIYILLRVYKIVTKNPNNNAINANNN